MSEELQSPRPPNTASRQSHASELLTEADRIMTICNACRYCEGLCAVFPAMERRRIFGDGDLDQLANLCHNCGACLYDCQYAPPHEFQVGVPKTLAALRHESWRRYSWPQFMAKAYDRNATATAGALTAAVAGFIVLVAARLDGDIVQAHTGEGAFYEVIPHGLMVVVFVAALVLAAIALGVSLRRFWGSIGGAPMRLPELKAAARSANTLEYLDGGGAGCMNDDEDPTDTRRRYHHLTYYGFMACLASTTLAAVLETGFEQTAPYPLWHPVVILGTIGGAGLIAGPAGLLAAKRRRDPQLGDPDSRSLDTTLIAMMMLLSVTGFGVLVLRSTGAMPLMLAIHLGVVFAFFVTIPYSKFVHGFYRYLALVKEHQERSPRQRRSSEDAAVLAFQSSFHPGSSPYR